MLYGRQAAALYGAGSGYSEGRVSIELPGGRYGEADLVLTGLDDERAAQTGFQVLVNGVMLFDGPSGFPKVPDGDNGEGGGDRHWGRMVVTIPAGVLRPGQNTVVLRNTTGWLGYLGVPYILINGVRLVY